MIPNKYSVGHSGDNTSALTHTGWHVSHEKDSSAHLHSQPVDSYNHSGADRDRKTNC